jgi:hypothetical protein
LPTGKGIHNGQLTQTGTIDTRNVGHPQDQSMQRALIAKDLPGCFAERRQRRTERKSACEMQDAKAVIEAGCHGKRH